MARARRDDLLFAPALKRKGSAPTSSAPAPAGPKSAKAASISRSVLALRPEAAARARAAASALVRSGPRHWAGRVDEHGDRGGWRHQFAQQLQPLRPRLDEKELTPVTLPPGRLRLATRPSLTGSPPVQRRSGSSWSPPWPRAPRACCPADDHGHLTANQIGRQRRQPIVLTFRPAVFDRDVLALDEAGFAFKALAETRHEPRPARARRRQETRSPASPAAARAPPAATPPPRRREA